MKRLLALIAVLAMVGAACGSDDEADVTTTAPSDGDTTTTVVPDLDPDRLVLRVGNVGGFMPVDFFVNETPRYELYGDGTLYFEGVQPAIFPGPLLNTMQRTNIGSDLLGVLDLVQLMGLPDIDDESDDTAAQFVADAGTTVALYRDDKGDHIYRVYALGIDLPEGQAEFDERSRVLGQLVSFLDDLTLDATGDSYQPEQLQLFIRPTFEGEQASDIADWPLEIAPEDFDPTSYPDWSCAVIDADPDLVDLLGSATQATHFTAGDSTYIMKGRGLLPAESGCQPLFDS